MEPPQDAFEKKDASAKSLNELLNLLLKLNARLREKIYPPKKKENPSGHTDVVIIIMTNKEETSRNGKVAKTDKPNPPAEDWMKEMFAQIEGGSVRRRKKP
jgi:hypothetical protein